MLGCRGVLGIAELSVDGGIDDPTVPAAEAGAKNEDASSLANDASVEANRADASSETCDAGTVPVFSNNDVPCPGGDCAARFTTCCLGPSGDAGACIQNGNYCQLADRPRACLHARHCAVGYHCCLDAKNVNAATCPPRGDLAAATCELECPQTIELCSVADGCANGKKCQPFLIAAPDPILTGACL